MKLPKSFTTVTPLSKALAAVLFITFPFVGFFAGMQYQKGISPQSNLMAPAPTSTISPVPTSQSPNPTSGAIEGMLCGGLTGKACPSGYFCQLRDRNPDASGKCVSAEYNTKPNCTPHVPIGGTGGMPPNYVYPTLPPGGSWCPESYNEMPPKSWDDSVCTQDAKLCPDGSSVGRQGPSCEFAKCP